MKCLCEGLTELEIGDTPWTELHSLTSFQQEIPETKRKKLRCYSPDLSVFTNKPTTSHRKAEEMAGPVLIRETKGTGGGERMKGGVCAVCGNWKARISGR